MSGEVISGVTTSANAIGERGHQAMQRASAVGAAMDYRDMYDVDDAVRADIDEAASAFTDNNGKAQSAGVYRETLSADDAFTLSHREELSDLREWLSANLQSTKAKQEGLERKLDERTLGQINANKALIEGAAQSGKVTIGQVEGRNVCSRWHSEQRQSNPA